MSDWPFDTNGGDPGKPPVLAEPPITVVFPADSSSDVPASIKYEGREGVTHFVPEEEVIEAIARRVDAERRANSLAADLEDARAAALRRTTVVDVSDLVIVLLGVIALVLSVIGAIG